MIECCAILHNYLLSRTDTFPQELFNRINDHLDVEDTGYGDDDYHLDDNEHDRREAVFRSILSQYWHA